MQHKSSAFERKFTKVTTGTPIFFVLFIIIGVLLFLGLTLTTKIDVIKSYPAKVIASEGESALLVTATNIPTGLVYVYSNRNEALYPISVNRTESSGEDLILFLDNNGQDVIKSLLQKEIFIDITQGKKTLLYEIFVKGGKAGE
jgi:hypothetical protein